MGVLESWGLECRGLGSGKGKINFQGYLVLGFDPLTVAYFPFVDPDRETAVGIGTGPSFEHDRGSVLAVVRQRDHQPIIAFLAFRQVHLHTS